VANFIKFNSVAAAPWNGLFNLGSDTVKAILSNVAPVATNAVYTDITEIANGNGYTTGGVSLTLTSSSQVSGLYKYIATITSPTWTSSGAGMATFRYAVIYDNTSATKPLLGAWDYGSALSLAATQTFSLQFDTTNGIIQHS
jgi:hypothetical protein